MKEKITILYFLAIVTYNSYSASDIYFSKIGIEQGLSQFSVTSMYQDELGAMWLATRQGLNRYNGNSVEVFLAIPNDSNSLGENLILNVCGDKSGNVYILTPVGVNAYCLRTSQMKLIQKKVTDGIAYGIRNLWISEGNKLYKYQDGKKELYVELEQPEASIKKILQTKDQRIFLGTVSSGVFVVDQNKKTRCVIPNCSMVSDIFEDSKMNVWVSTWKKGLFKIDREANIENYRFLKHNSPLSISSDFVRAVTEDNNNFIWIGTQKGLDRLNVETGEFKHYDSESQNNMQLSNASVWSLLNDSQGTIWIGSFFGGLNYFNPNINYYTLHNLQNGVFLNRPFPIISAIVEVDSDNLILCTEGDGIINYNLKTMTYKVFKADDSDINSLSSDNIKSAWYDVSSNELWLATHLGGLSMFNTKTQRITQYPIIKPQSEGTNVLSAVIPFGDNLLIGTQRGLFYFDKKEKKFTLYSEKLHKNVVFIQDVKIDNSGNVWVAGFNGVYRFDPKTEQIEHFANNPLDTLSLSNNNVSKILMDSKDRIWLATNGGGVNLFNPKTKNFKRYDSKHIGLNNNFVRNLIESKFGYIILSTTKGFSVLDVENNKIQNFDSNNGLPLNSLFSGGMCLTNKGVIFLSGMNGMVSFNEENLSSPFRPFNLHLVNLWVNESQIQPNDETKILNLSLAYTNSIELNHRQTMLSIEFASNNYIQFNQPVYRYKLEGFSDIWTKLPQGIFKINFMNLSAGKYNLIVQAVSPINDTIIASTQLEMRVLPPFYFAWYAWLFYVIIISIIIWRYMVFSRSRLLLQTSLSYEKKEKKHLEEVNQSKLRFFTNISHEFRTPLTLITGQVDMLLQTHNIQPTVYNRILNIKRNAQNMTSLINELLEFRKSEQGHLSIKAMEVDIEKFLYEIYLSFSEYANYRQISLNFDCRVESSKVWIDPAQMQKVFYNLISNAFKFTPKNGMIGILMYDASDVLHIKITDSGIGIGAEELEKIFDRFYQAENGIQINNLAPGTGIGLALVKNILELHDADIKVESQQKVGSCFTVTLKKGKAHFKQDDLAEPIDTSSNYMEQMQEIDTEFMQELIKEQVTDDSPKYSMLIVEDNDELRAMLESIFEPLYTIYKASDGKEGFDLTVEQQPDIVLSDLMMPIMSGSEMCSKIKNNFAVCHIPVVLLTAQTAIEHNIEGLRLGADDYITKPFNVKTLITRCNNLVNGRRILQEKYSRQADLSPRLIATNNMDREFLDKAMQVIEKHIDNSEFDVQMFSSEMALGRTKLFSKLKGITGQTPNDFIITVKMKKAVVLLKNNPEYNISDISYMLGFNSPKYFATCFKEQFGVQPSSYRKIEQNGEED